jgi:uncharacterized protein
MLSVVIDTNVLIAGMLKGSTTTRQIINHLSQSKFKLIISPESLEELIEVMNRPKFHPIISRETAAMTMEIIKTQAIFIKPLKKLHIVKEDPDDNMFLELALEAAADCLVSGDDHLLSLKSFRGIPIIKPKEFLTRLKK